MAEKSILWTTGATGDGATAYTQAEVIRWQRQFFVGADNEGVAKGYLNELATTGASSPVATNTGGAYVYGFPYWNTTSKDTAIPTPSGNTRIDRLVLRAGWSAQTIRITRIAGTEGSGTPPAIVQTDGTTWDNPLYQVSITTGGVITLTDEREFLHPNIAVDGNMLDDDAVDSQHYTNASIDLAHMSANSVDSPQYVDDSIDLIHLSADSVDDTKAGNRVPQFYRRQGGNATQWDNPGSTTYTPGAVRMQAGSYAVVFNGSGSNEEETTVTFPVAFSARPLVFATVDNADAVYHINVTVREVTTTTAILRLRAFGALYASVLPVTTSTAVNWFAIGPE